jgi:hypothetical protein
MTLPKWDPKDPNDIADYWFDFGSDDLAAADRFLPDAETITAATVSIADDGDQPAPVLPFDFLAIVSQSFTTKKVRVRLSGGVPKSATEGNKYPVNCLITTNQTQQFEITKTLVVKERTK